MTPNARGYIEMQVTPKAYKIWMVLFERPNTWTNVGDIAYEVDMSNRQVLSVLQTMNSPYIEKEVLGDYMGTAVKLTISDEDFRRLRREVLMSYHELDEEVFNRIRSTLSPIGWTSAQDISNITGYRGSRVYVAMSLMDDVISKDTGSNKLYMLC